MLINRYHKNFMLKMIICITIQIITPGSCLLINLKYKNISDAQNENIILLYTCRLLSDVCIVTASMCSNLFLHCKFTLSIQEVACIFYIKHTDNINYVTRLSFVQIAMSAVHAFTQLYILMYSLQFVKTPCPSLSAWCPLLVSS